ncbi:zinc finger CCCH-type with G patch domain-containing protein [Augochlora pura]
MTDVESLKEAITHYEEQLAQVQATLSSTAEGPDRENLLSLKSDIEELINLTKESLQSIESGDTENDSSTEVISDDDDDDPLAKEYALFKAALKKFSDDSESTKQNEQAAGASSNNIEEELKQLEGMKCRAPYGSSWGGVGYHNAMICSVHWTNDKMEIKTMQDIRVRVFFLNSTHKEMLPCPYYLDGKCKFSDEECRFSHGEIVLLSSIQEYREPEYQSIKMGSRVLAKQKNELWHRGVVLKMPDKDGDPFRIKFESSGNIIESFLQDILPLDDADLEMSDTSDDSGNENSDTPEYSKDVVIHQSLLSMDGTVPIGNWEKYTRGMGSKIMAQMGYVVGTGLGKNSDGRIVPVETTVLPAGKSLDHCMELRANAGGEKSLFSVERRMRKQQQKLEQQRERQYQREKRRDEKNVFNFINATLGDKPKNETQTSSTKSKNDLKTESNRQLNVASLQIGENILRVERESSKLRESLARHAKGSIQYNTIAMKYNEKQKELVDLRASEKNITAEQNQRKNRAKLSIF